MRQPELRRDPLRDTWTIFSEERRRRPSEYKFQKTTEALFDPFLPGQEKSTPPEIFAFRPANTNPNTPGWSVRVVPNRYPALRIEGQPEGRPDGIFDLMDGLGAHEVVIETPEENPLEDTSQEHIAQVLAAWKQRIIDLTKDARFQYISIFKNHGPLAGATLRHAHSQIIALPVVPEMIQRMCHNAARYHQWKNRHWFRDLINHELKENKRVAYENSSYIVLCPYSSRFLFETAIYPRRISASFETCSTYELNQLANALQATLRRLNATLEKPAYNITLLNAPLNVMREYTPQAALVRDTWCWHIEITPRLGTLAGLEIGTGFHINTVLPEDAARQLRNVNLA
jgi:UDPglucose--hexose-1-phosphate uridylyltransferase